MRTLIDRISFWWGERKAEIEDRTEDLIVPPADQVLDRLAAWYTSTRQQLKATHWMRGRRGHS